MSPTRPHALLAPGAPTTGASFPGTTPSPSRARAPGSRERLPAIDDNLLVEDQRLEIVDGVAVETMAAKEPHAVPHFHIPGVLARCLAPDYEGAVDMLTRVDRRTEFAPDVSIFPKARDAHGGRLVDELALEINDATRLGESTVKARKLSRRGVRRVFALNVTDRSLREWDAARDAWTVLPDDFILRDKVLVEPVPLAAFFDDLCADDAVARALLGRGNKVLAASQAAAEARGEARGKAEAVLAVLAARGLPVTEAQAAAARACADTARLDAWLRAVATTASVDQLLALGA